MCQACLPRSELFVVFRHICLINEPGLEYRSQAQAGFLRVPLLSSLMWHHPSLIQHPAGCGDQSQWSDKAGECVAANTCAGLCAAVSDECRQESQWVLPAGWFEPCCPSHWFLTRGSRDAFGSKAAASHLVVPGLVCHCLRNESLCTWRAFLISPSAHQFRE